MLSLLVALSGAILGLTAHDLAIQGLTAHRPLRPLVGVCPRCGHRRGWLRLRCPECGRPVRRELLFASVSALTALGFVGTIGLRWPLIAYGGFLLLSGALLITDLEQLRIVDRINLRGTAMVAVLLAVTAVAVGDLPALARGLAGAAIYFAGAFLLWTIVRGRGFGGGDVKLAPQIGLFTAYVSWGTLGWAAFATAMIGGVLAIALLITGRAHAKTELPYGPPMILGAWLAIALVGAGLP
ncbi:MAG TPA: prepilin peptidase [Acidimicrobiia bacterium]|nr:prepilin peptidase [Acidimicrobiia bacterium]